MKTQIQEMFGNLSRQSNVEFDERKRWRQVGLHPATKKALEYKVNKQIRRVFRKNQRKDECMNLLKSFIKTFCF